MSNFVNLLDIIYPVGSVYITFSNVSPVDSVGGSWEKIDGKFLYATSTPNQTGWSLKHSHKYGLVYTMWWYSIGIFQIMKPGYCHCNSGMKIIDALRIQLQKCRQIIRG